MSNIPSLMNKHFTRFFENSGLWIPNQATRGCESAVSFRLHPDKGSGTYRLIPFGDQFWISIIDLCFTQDTLIEYPQFDFLSFSYYESALEERLESQVTVSGASLLGYTAAACAYRSKIHANVPYRATSIILLPGYYEHRLREQYGSDYDTLQNALRQIDGPLHIPELNQLLVKLKQERVIGIAAKLHYESVVTQALALLVAHVQQRTTPVQTQATRTVSSEDKEGIAQALRIIDTRYSDAGLRLNQLARSAKMSPTKFKQIFKRRTGYSVSSYILLKRMDRARLLLKSSDMEIAAIAREVGYQKSGSFSEAFKKYTGIVPHLYRKQGL